MQSELVQLDGSLGEGGGQILRTSLTLSLLTGQPFHLRNIRARRPKPGLQPQHLMSVRAAAACGSAHLTGDRRDSTELIFHPGPVVAGKQRFDIGTAGATGLVLQTIYLPLALRGNEASEVTITGGTHVKTSPSFSFLDLTWRAYLALMGLQVELTMRRPGFYPRGGGEIVAVIQPASAVRPLQITAHRTAVSTITGFSAVAGLPESIAERQANQAIKRLKKAKLRADIAVETWEGGPGTVIGLQLDDTPVPTLLVAIGERGKPAERVADEAVDELLQHLAADASAVDRHSGDQLVLPLAMASGPSEYPVASVSRHLLTNIEVIRRFLDREIEVKGDEGKLGIVAIR